MSIVTPTTTRQPLGRAIARIALGAVLVIAGVGHLTAQREEFQAQVPDWVPFSKDFVVLASGGVEIALGAALIALPRHRKVVSWIVAAFFVVIFPGNINQYVEHIDAFGLDTDQKRLTRLFFQPVLVLWAIAAGTGERRA
ncbi:DoxX family membrane protein [Gordonia hongkongensis]|uniref:DoxX family membrane protein n=1 Tax=Gordonia hongkongensis TaxID=1701090 RepID=A0AAX3T6B9_9ACTN|nr:MULTISPECIES: MauE/DoxX family redox-associated membrane protein [Gordonia]MBR7193696.1 DoxX family membrane protein [Gordonia sp. SCSIO 19800]MDF6101288.1 DoxX family membrane protein [Gordonia hongkongensis]QIK46501.1 DoxX family membrane protein [Gordonia terrae]WFP24505.1 DoxX family membrane protein [Gordonia hongkongensis]